MSGNRSWNVGFGMIRRVLDLRRVTSVKKLLMAMLIVLP